MRLRHSTFVACEAKDNIREGMDGEILLPGAEHCKLQGFRDPLWAILVQRGKYGLGRLLARPALP